MNRRPRIAPGRIAYNHDAERLQRITEVPKIVDARANLTFVEDGFGRDFQT